MAELRAFFTHGSCDSQPELLTHACDEEEKIRDKRVFGFHDIYSGSLLYGIDRGNCVGADIYFFENVDTDPLKAHRAILGWINPANTTDKILPFGHSKKYKITKDSGEQGTIHIVHTPLLKLVQVNYI